MPYERRAKDRIGAAALSRRGALQLGLGAWLASAHPPACSAQSVLPANRVAVFDWGLAETLLAVGVTPVALSETAGYRQWVIEPPLPPAVADAGLRVEPNFELLAAMRPDLILITPELEPLRPMLERIGRTEMLGIYLPSGDVWKRARETALRLASLVGRERQGEALLADADRTIETARKQLGTAPRRPVYLVNFIDRRHVRVYGEGSIFHAVLSRLGLTNAYSGGANFWGFSTLGIEHLADHPNAELIYLEPLPDEARATFEISPLWAALPFVREGRVSGIPPVWSFGGIASGARLARLIGDRLSGDARTAGEAGRPPS